MVFTISLKNLSFKQNLADIDAMLDDQPATYAILKHATDVPEEVYFHAIYMLEEKMSDITYPKLIELVYAHISCMEEVAENVFFGGNNKIAGFIEE